MYVCTTYALYECTHIFLFMFVCFPVLLADCHVAHLFLSSCLTLGLSWISLGPRWQWSRQHRFGSCHMGRLQGNRLYQSLQSCKPCYSTCTNTQTEYLLSRQVCTVHVKLNKHVKLRGQKNHAKEKCGINKQTQIPWSRHRALWACEIFSGYNN